MADPWFALVSLCGIGTWQTILVPTAIEVSGEPQYDPALPANDTHEVEPVDADRLFVHTLSDLEQRTAATDEYEVLLSAALLRKLLLDQPRLMDQVNHHYRLDLCFRISGVSPFEQQIWDNPPIFWALEDVLDPDSPLAYAPFDASRDQFLGRRIMRFSESWITIRDVIDQLANIEGAVHSGNPKKEQHKVLQAAGKFYSRDGLPGVVSQVRLIGRITVRGLSPLRDAVLAAGTATWVSASSNGSVKLQEDDPEERTERGDERR